MENIQPTEDTENCISIFIPMSIKKRGGGAATVILPKNRSLEDNKPNYDHRLITALTKAYKLQKTLTKHPNMSIISLAEKEGLTHGYVGRLLRLNLLAPDIIEAILNGKQPRDLKLKELITKEIPEVWQEQREKFGFLFSTI